MTGSTIYEAAGGQAGILALARAWHERCLADPVVSHAFSHGHHPQHVERLAAYWTEALGGPTAYTDGLGDESGVLRMHSGNGEHRDMDARALDCFTAALDDAGLPADPRLRAVLTRWFDWELGSMSTYPDTADDVPPGLPVPRWTWEGPACDATP